MTVHSSVPPSLSPSGACSCVQQVFMYAGVGATKMLRGDEQPKAVNAWPFKDALYINIYIYI